MGKQGGHPVLEVEVEVEIESFRLIECIVMMWPVLFIWDLMIDGRAWGDWGGG